MSHSIKIKIHPAVSEIAKPLQSIASLPGQPDYMKNAFQVIICCPNCKKEQTVLLNYTLDKKILDIFATKLLQQMDIFKINYCGCPKAS